MHIKIRIGIVVAVLLALVGGIGVLLSRQVPNTFSGSSATLHVVAAENFWGSIASQIGGADADVTSIVADPNADPHDYETTTSDAKRFATANYVILNGVGYDSWGDKLIAGNPNTARKVLIVGDLVGKKNGDNPHIWYNPTYVNLAAKQIESDMIALDPVHTAHYEMNYEALMKKLAVYQGTIAEIQHTYAGTKIAATEDIAEYLASATGLDLISPPAFTHAVAEGSDPTAQSIAQFESQLTSGEVKVFIYNTQTETPLTDTVKNIAQSENIPIVGITETVSPEGISFEDWMDLEVENLMKALGT